MDKREVIEGLRGLKELFREGVNLQIVLDMAIEALEQEPTAEYSSDVISRQAAINAIEKAVFKGVAKSAIESLPSADRPKWIPCSERLPEEGDVVLICSKIGVIDFGKRKGDKWVWLAEALWDYWQETEDLIAWMPLPEAYKESDIDGSN